MPTVSYAITNTADDASNLFGTVDPSGVVQGNLGGSAYAGLRFLGIAVPQGATITSATLTLIVGGMYGTGNGSSLGVWRGVASDNAPAWTAGNLGTTSNRTTASATVLGSATAETSRAHDVTAIVQEIVNRSGWSSGNAMAIAGDPTGATNYCPYYDYADNPAKAAMLSITYADAGGGAVESTGTATGTGSGAATGRGFKSSSGAATGVGAGTAVGRSFKPATGAAFGSAGQVGAGRAVLGVAGASLGTGVAGASAGSIVQASAPCTGLGAATGSGQSVAIAAGSAIGGGSGAALTRAIASATGSASGAASVWASGATDENGGNPEPTPFLGIADGISVAAAVGRAVTNAGGFAGGNSAAMGAAMAEAWSAGQPSGTSSATGQGRAVTAATGIAAASSSAIGRAPPAVELPVPPSRSVAAPREIRLAVVSAAIRTVDVAPERRVAVAAMAVRVAA